MKISKVKLLESGLKGVEVNYLSENPKEDLTFNDEHNSKFRTPAHKELKSEFRKMKFHLLTLCGYWREDYGKHYNRLKDHLKDPGKDISSSYEEVYKLLDSTNVTTISCDEDGNFQISGSIKVIGRKRVQLVTPKITQADEYDFESEALKLVDKVFAEVKSYVSGKTLPDTEQFLLEFYKDVEAEKIEEIKSLPAVEQKEEMKRILEEEYGVLCVDPADTLKDPEEQLEQKKADLRAVQGGKSEKDTTTQSEEDNATEETKQAPVAEEKEKEVSVAAGADGF